MKKAFIVIFVLTVFVFNSKAQILSPSNMEDVAPPKKPTKITKQYVNNTLTGVLITTSKEKNVLIPLQLPSAKKVKGMIKSGMFPLTDKELIDEGWSEKQIASINKDTLISLVVEYDDLSYYEYQTIYHTATKLNDVVVRYGVFKQTDYGFMATETSAYYLGQGVPKSDTLYNAVNTLIQSKENPVCATK